MLASITSSVRCVRCCSPFSSLQDPLARLIRHADLRATEAVVGRVQESAEQLDRTVAARRRCRICSTPQTARASDTSGRSEVSKR